MTADLLLIKIAVSIAIVLGLSILAEKTSPRLAGVVSGYPLGGAIILFFIGYEIGPGFAATSALYSIAGFGGILFFLGAWYLVLDRINARFWQVVFSAISAIAAFFAYAWLISGFPFTVLTATLLTLLIIAGSIWLFHKIPEAQISKPVKLGPSVILVRAAMATLVIVLVTGSAHYVGAEWAGLFTGFPAAVFPLLLILHTTYGPGPVRTIIRNFPFGLVSLVIYSICVTYLYPALGIGWGTVAAFGCATVYLVSFVYAREKGWLPVK